MSTVADVSRAAGILISRVSHVEAGFAGERRRERSRRRWKQCLDARR